MLYCFHGSIQHIVGGDRIVSDAISFSSDLVHSHVATLQRAGDASNSSSGISPNSGLPELAGIDAAFTSVSSGLGLLAAGYRSSLAASAGGMTESLATLIEVEQDIVASLSKIIGALR